MRHSAAVRLEGATIVVDPQLVGDTAALSPRRRARAFVVPFLVLLLLLAGPMSTRRAAASSPLLRLDYLAGTFGNLAPTLDPAYAGYDAEIVQLTNAGLVRLLPNGSVTPELATWTVSPDRRTYTFTLRPRARFANGHMVNARAVAFSLQRALSPQVSSALALLYLRDIQGATAFAGGSAPALAGVSVLDRRTVRITLERADTAFLLKLAAPPGDVLDPAVVGTRSSMDGTDLTQTCVANQGAGPFHFLCRSEDSNGYSFTDAGQTPTYSLAPNPYYAGKHPGIELQIPSIYSGPETYAAFLAGGIDLTPLPAEEAGSVPPGVRERRYPVPAIHVLVPNTRAAPFNDPHCRRALAFAVDRAALAALPIPYPGLPTSELTPAGLPHHRTPADIPAHDVATARSELALCGSRTMPMQMTYLTGTSERDRFAQAVVGMLVSVGFDAHAQGVKAADWTGITEGPLSDSNIQLLLTMLPDRYPDPEDFLARLRCGDRENWGSWCNASFDRLMDRAMGAGSTARDTLLGEAERIALSDGAQIPLRQDVTRELIDPQVRGLVTALWSPYLIPSRNDWSRVTMGRP